jgi:hypothetical protein
VNHPTIDRYSSAARGCKFQHPRLVFMDVCDQELLEPKQHTQSVSGQIDI